MSEVTRTESDFEAETRKIIIPLLFSEASTGHVLNEYGERRISKALASLSHLHQQEMLKRTWYVVDKDAYDKRGDIIIGPFTTDSDASVAREYIERKDSTNHTFWLEQRTNLSNREDRA